ncbi:small ribosomal subunit biogenesis GTPase RsgA [Oculatella sp. LEGE 06141]|uniref:small ribosomal subunit biogenesis GTPase RsgA n=1 Tax=Oculatella sp. LEGE 06141 TaxID=1828648 RepID=UPI001880F19E|nr:small ribosomal subunit biogenesis GTPase RsgA [Oculatella sp. LEGE 06141]MBE9177034.1 small ribosomal subunit biogenesis GTPase RsgA [Oculatella sp. LEGE 06141]
MNAESANRLKVHSLEVGTLLGTVLAVQANYYWVKLDTGIPLSVEKTTLLCTRRARLKKIGQQVIVGDRVRVEEPDWTDGRGAIAQVFPRRSQLDRPPIANVDQILLIFSLAEPSLDPFQLSRFLVKAESTGLEICLCFNKSDLVSLNEQQYWCDRISKWGYSPLVVSVQTRSGLMSLQDQLDQKITVVSGPSGVGKSSLINNLIPTIDLRIGAVSGKLGRGRHTTRHVELFELPTGGLLADTPGFNQPDLNYAPHELAGYFPEIRQQLAEAACQFSDCLHQDEPNCAVSAEWERYEHYSSFLADVVARQESIDQSTDAESATKAKTGDEGQIQYEPKLAPKKYRRPSRRAQRQALQDLRYDVDTLTQDND